MINFKEKLNELILKHDLSSFKEKIFSLSEESICMTLGDKEDYSKIGSSRCCGYPDLPESIEWPIITEAEDEFEEFTGIRKLFAVQINLEEIPDIGKLPTTGMLYFFIGCNTLIGDDDSNVIYYPKTDDLKNNFIDKIDETFCLYGDDENKYHIKNGYKLNFSKILTIPSYYSDLCKLLELKGEDGEKYESLCKEYSDFIYSKYRDKFLSRMFGHMNFGWHDIRNENEEVILGLCSSNKTGFCFNDLGFLYFIIDKENLTKMNIDTAYSSIYSN